METNDISAITERVKKDLNDFYNGDSWVTENFKERVLSLPPGMALKKAEGHSHSVAQLTAHITCWRNFVVQKLTGNDNYDIDDNSIIDWPEPADWHIVCRDFETCHQNLLAAIESFSKGRWETKVPGRNYSFLTLVNGIIQHDYYHYGQIGSVRAANKDL